MQKKNHAENKCRAFLQIMGISIIIGLVSFIVPECYLESRNCTPFSLKTRVMISVTVTFSLPSLFYLIEGVKLLLKKKVA